MDFEDDGGGVRGFLQRIYRKALLCFCLKCRTIDESEEGLLWGDPAWNVELAEKSFHEDNPSSRLLSEEIDQALAAAGTVPKSHTLALEDLKNLPPYRLGDIDRSMDIIQDDYHRNDFDTRQIPSGIQRRSQLIGRKVDALWDGISDDDEDF